MIFRIAALLLLSLSSLQFTSAIEVSMINMDDVSENHRVVSDAFNPYGDSSYVRGVSMIKSGLKKLLINTANQDMDVSSMDPQEWHEVQTTFLTSTSKYHQDHKHDETRTLVEDEVGFVALNTNEDAYFDHPDMKVPIREGAFIRFKGSDPHRTVVNKGSVHLLGPFDLKSFGKVGAPFCCDFGDCVFPNPDAWQPGTSDEDACSASGYPYGGGYDCPDGCGYCCSVSGDESGCVKTSFAFCFEEIQGQAYFLDPDTCSTYCVPAPEPCEETKSGKAGKADNVNRRGRRRR